MQNKIKKLEIESLEKLSEKLFEVEKDKTIRVVILEFFEEEKISNAKFNEKILEQIENFPKPIILQIKNRAKDFLFEILLATPLCIASDSAIFEIMDFEKLEKQISTKNLDKLKNLEAKFDAETALSLGIINKIVETKNLESETLELAEQIADNAPIAVEYILEAVNQGLELNLEEGLKLETELFCKIFATEDMKEGTKAFFEKRKPHFQGK